MSECEHEYLDYRDGKVRCRKCLLSMDQVTVGRLADERDALKAENNKLKDLLTDMSIRLYYIWGCSDFMALNAYKYEFTDGILKEIRNLLDRYDALRRENE